MWPINLIRSLNHGLRLSTPAGGHVTAGTWLRRIQESRGEAE